MKKISTVVGGIGFLIAFLTMSCDVENHPILSIPIIIGLGLLYVSYKIGEGWCDFEEIDANNNINSTDVDDDITYITYDSKGNTRYMDM